LIGTPPKDKPTIGTVVVFHGNAGHAGHRSYYASMLTELGIRTILAEYPGYGPRSGKPSEDVLISDGVEIVRQVHQLYGKPVWLLGESLGAGVAAAVVKEAGALVQGIVLITPWNRLIDVAVFHYPYLPVRSLLKSNYDSIDALLEFDGPKLVIVADDDVIVPTELGLNLYRQTSQPKRLVRVENAGHNDWINFVDREFWQNNMGWLIDASRK
jgi:pimeloyl-ACP methyl ester carboxylesterase